jgi:DNA-binding phage protein
LADFAGVARGQLYAVFAGRYSPTINWLEKVAAALEVELVELLQPGAQRKAP